MGRVSSSDATRSAAARIAGPVGVGLSVVLRGHPQRPRRAARLEAAERAAPRGAAARRRRVEPQRRRPRLQRGGREHRHHRRARGGRGARDRGAAGVGRRDPGCGGAARRIARLADPRAASGRPSPRPARDDEGEGGPHLRCCRRGIRARQGASRPAHDRGGPRAPRIPLDVEQGLRILRALRGDRPHRPEPAASVELDPAAGAVPR